MRMRTGLMLVAVLSFALGGCKPSEQAQQEKAAADADLKAMEGKWKVVSREGTEEEEGEKADQDPSFYFVIENGVLREEFKDAGGKVEVFGRRKLNLQPGKSPKAVDLVWVDENGKEIKERTTKRGITGKRKTSTTALKQVGVYKIEGDKLEINMTWDEKNRPTDFTVPPKSSRYLLKLERMKSGDEPPAAKPAGDGKDKDKDKDKGGDKPKGDGKDKD